MNKIILILGNITFDHFSDKELKKHFGSADQTSENKCLIHEIYGVIRCESIEQAELIGENLCNEFSAYVIPSVFNGIIKYESSVNMEYVLVNSKDFTTITFLTK